MPCPIPIVNLLFANLEMGRGAKWQGAKCQVHVFFLKLLVISNNFVQTCGNK